jgi:hypothetical protein
MASPAAVVPTTGSSLSASAPAKQPAGVEAGGGAADLQRGAVESLGECGDRHLVLSHGEQNAKLTRRQPGTVYQLERAVDGECRRRSHPRLRNATPIARAAYAVVQGTGGLVRPPERSGHDAAPLVQSAHALSRRAAACAPDVVVARHDSAPRARLRRVCAPSGRLVGGLRAASAQAWADLGRCRDRERDREQDQHWDHDGFERSVDRSAQVNQLVAVHHDFDLRVLRTIVALSTFGSIRPDDHSAADMTCSRQAAAEVLWAAR